MLLLIRGLVAQWHGLEYAHQGPRGLGPPQSSSDEFGRPGLFVLESIIQTVRFLGANLDCKIWEDWKY